MWPRCPPIERYDGTSALSAQCRTTSRVVEHTTLSLPFSTCMAFHPGRGTVHRPQLSPSLCGLIDVEAVASISSDLDDGNTRSRSR